MKKTLLSLALAAGLSISSQAATTSQTVSHTFDNSGNSTYSFSQFDSSLGTLTSITYFLVSSVDGGDFYVKNDNVSTVTVKSPKDFLTVVDNQTGFANYDGSNITLVTTPATGSTGFTLAGNSSQTFTVTPKSLIGAGSVSFDLSADIATYTGNGSVTFAASIAPSVSITGGVVTFDMSKVTNTTVMTMTYTYNAIPEPSVALMLLLGGFAGFVIVRRRKAMVA